MAIIHSSPCTRVHVSNSCNVQWRCRQHQQTNHRFIAAADFSNSRRLQNTDIDSYNL